MDDKREGSTRDHVRVRSVSALRLRHQVHNHHRSSVVALAHDGKITGKVSALGSSTSEYDFEIKHRRGQEHGNADALSRLPILNACEPNEYEPDGLWTTEEMIATAAVRGPSIGTDDQLLTVVNMIDSGTQKISAKVMMLEQQKDPALQDVRKRCRESDDGRDQVTGMYLLDNLMYIDRKGGQRLLAVPWGLVERILSMYHNEASAVHMSRDRLYKHLEDRFYWRGMFTDAARWTNACRVCRATKPTRPSNHGLLQPIEVQRPLEALGVDIMGPCRSRRGAHGMCWFVSIYLLVGLRLVH